MKLKLILVFIATMILSACGATLPQIQYVDKTIVVSPDKTLTTNCKVSKPPVETDYITTEVAQREESLYLYSKSLLTDLAVCNLQWKTLREWQDKQENIYKETPVLK